MSVRGNLSALFTKISDYSRNNIDPDRLYPIPSQTTKFSQMVK